MVDKQGLLFSLFAANVVVTVLLAIWVVSVGTGNDSWLPSFLNPTAALKEDVDDALDSTTRVDSEAVEAQELADDAQISAYDAQGIAERAQETANNASADSRLALDLIRDLCYATGDTFSYEFDVAFSFPCE